MHGDAVGQHGLHLRLGHVVDRGLQHAETQPVAEIDVRAVAVREAGAQIVVHRVLPFSFGIIA